MANKSTEPYKENVELCTYFLLLAKLNSQNNQDNRRLNPSVDLEITFLYASIPSLPLLVLLECTHKVLLRKVRPEHISKPELGVC